MRTALKELRETIRWIKLAQRSQLIEKPDLADPLPDEADQLIRTFAKSISTAEDNL